MPPAYGPVDSPPISLFASTFADKAYSEGAGLSVT